MQLGILKALDLPLQLHHSAAELSVFKSFFVAALGRIYV
jgi:hypothetical protein